MSRAAKSSRAISGNGEGGSEVPQHKDNLRGLKYRKINVSNNDPVQVQVRNHLAVQSALYRGDVNVNMHNTDTWAPDQRIRGLPLFRPNSDTDPAATRLLGFGGHVRSQPNTVSAEIYSRILEIMNPSPAWKGFDFISHELVAVGGNGVVLSAKVRFQNRRERELIIKMTKDPAQPIQAERQWHQKYAGATHTVQVCDLNALARENADPARAATYPSDPLVFDEEKLGILVLEKAVHGDLYQFLNRVTAHGLEIPAKALWSMWLCLIKMLASIDYQPSSNKMEDKDFEAWLRTAEKDPSTIADYVKDFSVSHHVHFDLNLSNVLLTQDVRLDHDQHPLYKAHDFDERWSKDMREAWKDDGWTEGRYWQMRRHAKSWLTPEQVSREWDDFTWAGDNSKDKFRGEDLTQGAKIAGRYGSWTNVFTVGVIMESVITGIWMRHPFRPERYQHSDSSVGEILTYGWRIPQYAPNVDPHLCEIVMRCQAEDPRDRPTSTELLENAALRMPRNIHDTDLDLQKFYYTIFHTPPPVFEGPSPNPNADDMPSTAPPGGPVLSQAVGSHGDTTNRFSGRRTSSSRAQGSQVLSQPDPIGTGDLGSIDSDDSMDLGIGVVGGEGGGDEDEEGDSSVSIDDEEE